VPVFNYLRIICNHVTGRRIIRLVRLELKVVMEKDGDFVDVSQLYSLSHIVPYFSFLHNFVNLTLWRRATHIWVVPHS
jgi:hypothetical protein